MKKKTLSLALVLVLMAALLAPVAVSAAPDIEISSGMLHIRKAATVYMKDYPTATMIHVWTDGVTIVGEPDKTYPVSIINTNSNDTNVSALTVVDLNLVDTFAFRLRNLRTLNVAGVCSMPSINLDDDITLNITGTLTITHRIIGADRVVICGDGTLIIDPGTSPDGAYAGTSSLGTDSEINTTVIARSTLGTSGVGENTLSARNNLYLGGHLAAYGTTGTNQTGSGQALVMRAQGKVIYTSADARVDLHPGDGAARNDVTFSKAGGVSGNWIVSPSSAIVSGRVTDNEIVIDVGSGSVSVWLVDGSDNPSDAPTAPALGNFAKTGTYTAETFTDIGGQWYTDWVSRAYEYGIIAGVGNNKFNPTGNLSGAEALTIGARIHSIYKYGAADGEAKIQAYKADGDQWYDMFVLYCKAEGLIGGELDSKLTAPITRSEMIFAWSKLLQSSDMPKQNTVNSLPDVTQATPYHDEIIYFYEAGILSGTDSNGTFAPNNNITRAEAATIFMRLIEADARGSGKAFGS